MSDTIRTLSSLKVLLKNNVKKAITPQRIRDMLVSLYSKSGGEDVRAHGAVGDGVTDDTAAIHLARDVSGANKVYFPAGTYKVSGLKANVVGQDWALDSGAIIKLANAANDQVIEVTASQVRILGGEIDGNKANQTTNGSGVFIGPALNDVHVLRVAIKDTLHGGVRVKGVTGTATKRVRVEGCRFDGCGQHSVYFNWEAESCSIANNHFVSGDQNAILVTNSSIDCLISGNLIDDTDRMGIEVIGGSHRAVVSGNKVRLSGTDTNSKGISVVGDGSSVTGNVIEFVTTPRDGVELVSSKGLSVTGNTIKNATSGIVVDKVSESSITGNNIVLATTNGVHLVVSGSAVSADDNVISGNVISFTSTAGVGVLVHANNAGATLDRNIIANNSITGPGTTATSAGTFLQQSSGSINDTTISGNHIQSVNRCHNRLSNTNTRYIFNVHNTFTTEFAGTPGAGDARMDTTVDAAIRLFGLKRLDFGNDGVLRGGGTDTVETLDDFKVGDGAFNGQRLRLGGNYLWVDAAGNLRIKSSAPTIDLDGVVVGAQS